MNRADVLTEAAKIVCGDRDVQYGSPEDSFALIGELWSVYLAARANGSLCITPTDVAVMMSLLKVARIAANPTKADSFVDLAGYAACGAECAGAK